MYSASVPALQATSTLRTLLALPCYPAMPYISSGKPYIHNISVDLPLKKHTLYSYAYAAPIATPACFGSHLKIIGFGVSFHHKKSGDLVVGFDVIKF